MGCVSNDRPIRDRLAERNSELESIGIQLKDRRIGLIDFPSELDGRPMLLCWQLGEPSVQFWHDVDAGYAGRQPLNPPVGVGPEI